MRKFRMGSLNHVHLVAPDRAAAASWYRGQLGFEPDDTASVKRDLIDPERISPIRTW